MLIVFMHSLISAILSAALIEEGFWVLNESQDPMTDEVMLVAGYTSNPSMVEFGEIFGVSCKEGSLGALWQSTSHSIAADGRAVVQYRVDSGEVKEIVFFRSGRALIATQETRVNMSDLSSMALAASQASERVVLRIGGNTSVIPVDDDARSALSEVLTACNVSAEDESNAR